MNPNAGEWKPSAAAAAWSPGGFQQPTQGSNQASSPPPPQTHADPEQPSLPPPPSQHLETNAEESDPLYQAVLKIAQGNKEKAEAMLNDPDSLVQYPEVNQLLIQTENADAIEQMVEDDEHNIHIDSDLADEMESKINLDSKMDNACATPMETEANDQHENDVNEDDDDDDDDDDEEVVPAGPVKEGDPREHLNLVFIGHVDAGKSTLSGNILYLTDNVDKRTIEKYEQEAKERNRDSWFLAFIMDTNEEERAKGKTVEVGKAYFETELKRYTILDAPGHKNYVPNMIQGACQADIAVLVISARKGEFETGFDRGGQTREHAMLAKTLGVSHLVVAVNKMDEPTVQWKKERYEECINKLRPFLKSCGFVIKREVKFIPISGLGGANVLKEVDPEVCSWWKDCYTSGENNTTAPTLISLLDTLEMTGRDAIAPLRIPVLDRYNDRGTIAMGKVESGTVRPGMKITIMPTNNQYKVDEVWANEVPVSAARPGENVLVKISGAKVVDILKGYVICGKPPCRAVDKIICQIAIADMPENQKIMTAGFTCMFHAHTCEEECTVSKIFETTNSKGQVVKGARFASVGMRAVVMLDLEQTASLETYDDFAFLGRFTLRTEGKTVAIGKVIKLPPKKLS